MFKEVSDLQANDGLEEACAIVAPREIRVLEHLLGGLSIELGGDVAEMALHIYQLI